MEWGHELGAVLLSSARWLWRATNTIRFYAFLCQNVAGSLRLAGWGVQMSEPGDGNPLPVDVVCTQKSHKKHEYINQAAKLIAALLRVAGVTAGLAESNGSLPPGI